VVYFLQQVGFSSSQSFDFGLGVNAIGWLGTVASWLVMQHFWAPTTLRRGPGRHVFDPHDRGVLGLPSGDRQRN